MANYSVKKMLAFLFEEQNNFIGEVKMYPGTTIPSNWHLCDGTALSRTTYSALFAAIGTTYGEGDGETTFNLPDLRNKFPIGADGTNRLLNSQGGTKNKIIPSHTHSVAARASTAMSANGTHDHYYREQTKQGASASNGWARPRSTNHTTEDDGYYQSYATLTHTHQIPAHSTLTAGDVVGQDINIPPYLGLNFIIYTGGTT